MQRDWRAVLWTDEVPLTIGKDPRRHWVTRRVREEYEDGFVIPAVRQGKQVMAWGIIGYNYKGPLYRFDLEACTPPLRYHLQRPFRETPANGINGPKYAEWIIRGPQIEAVRTFTNQGRLPIVMEDNSRVHNNEYCDLTRRDLGYRRLFHPPYFLTSIPSRTHVSSSREGLRISHFMPETGTSMGTGRQCLGGHPDELYQHPSGFHAEAIGGGSGCTRRGD